MQHNARINSSSIPALALHGKMYTVVTLDTESYCELALAYGVPYAATVRIYSYQQVAWISTKGGGVGQGGRGRARGRSRGGSTARQKYNYYWKYIIRCYPLRLFFLEVGCKPHNSGCATVPGDSRTSRIIIAK